MNNKIMILDGNSLLFRAFYAMPPLKTKKGQYTNAVYGFLSMLYKLIDTYSPEYICTAFDPKKPTFRHEQYKDYKAGRAKAPDELIQQFKLIRDVLEVHNIKCIEIEGFEADDVAGTIACEAENKGAEVYLVTSDKDYLQLISKNTKVLLTKKGVTNIHEMDEQVFFDEYGIKPEQFVDLKALMGDQSDNIPGVLGVGEKTALKLMQQYGNLDNIYENIEEIKGKLREKLESDKIQAYMSQTLARIIKDIPLEFDLEEFRLAEPDNDELSKLYDELEFRNFKKRLKEPTEPTKPTGPTKPGVSLDVILSKYTSQLNSLQSGVISSLDALVAQAQREYDAGGSLSALYGKYAALAGELESSTDGKVSSTLSKLEQELKDNGYDTSTVSDLNKEYEKMKKDYDVRIEL